MTSLPTSMQAWQYSSPSGGVENSIKKVAVPLPKPKANQHLVEVIASSLNPVDYKPVETPIIGRFLVSLPATPGVDFTGRIVTPASGSDLKPGDLVWGSAGTSPFAGGAWSQFTLVEEDHLARLPDELDPIESASAPTVALTALQSLKPYVKEGHRVFINGGSGGTGVFAIQIAKILGCHVTTTCSTANVDFCKGLGADEVIDYRKENVLEALGRKQLRFDHVVDNIGEDMTLYFKAQSYTSPTAKYVHVAKTVSPGFVFNLVRSALPTLLGGATRTLVNLMSNPNRKELDEIADLIKEGKIKTVIHSTYTFDQVPAAIAELKRGRTRGKIVLAVKDELTK